MGSLREQGRVFTPPPHVRFKRFGPLGPVYEIEEIKGRTARIRVLESGETLDYPLDRIEQDPAA